MAIGTMVQMDDTNPCVLSQALRRHGATVLRPQPAGQKENCGSDRGAQEWGTGKRNTMGKHRFRYIYGD